MGVPKRLGKSISRPLPTLSQTSCPQRMPPVVTTTTFHMGNSHFFSKSIERRALKQAPDVSAVVSQSCPIRRVSTLLFFFPLWQRARPPLMSSPAASGVTEDPAPVSVQLLLFASAREAAGGASRVTLSLPVGVVPGPAVREAIVAALPALAPLLPTCALAVNAEYVDEGAATPLVTGDELAVIPPISGG